MKGAGLIVIGGLIGAAVSAYYYFVPGANLDGEGGVMLVIISSLLMFAAGLVLPRISGFVASLLSILILLDTIGISICGYFLETPILLAAMALALVGWLMRVIGHAADLSVEVAK